MEKVYREGNKQKSKKRAIVAKFTSFKVKQKVLSETWRLKDTNININEDYSKETFMLPWSMTKLIGKRNTKNSKLSLKFFPKNLNLL